MIHNLQDLHQRNFAVIHPEQQNRVYETVLSHLKIQLPDNPMRYTAMPNALKGEGIWANKWN